MQQSEPLSMDGLADSESHELTTAGEGSGREVQARLGSSSGTNRREPGITAMEQQRWSEASSEHTLVGETERKSANHQGGQLDSKSVVAGNEQTISTKVQQEGGLCVKSSSVEQLGTLVSESGIDESTEDPMSYPHSYSHTTPSVKPTRPGKRGLRRSH